MPPDYVPQADEPVGGDPVLLNPSTFARHSRAVERVLGDNHSVPPRQGRGRTTHPSVGAWGYLASGHTISAGSGLSLGGGTVTLCSRSGGALTADGEDVPVLNSGATVTGPKSLALEWTDGSWAVCPPCTPVSTPDCFFCQPCQLPTKDLGYSYSGVAPLSPVPGSGSLSYDSDTDVWTSGSFAGGYTVDVQCISKTVTPRIMLSGASQCTFGAPSSTTCNSLSLVYDVPNPSSAYTAGFRTLHIIDPGPVMTPCPTPCAPCVNCALIVCGGLAGVTILPGGTVTDDSGTHAMTGIITDNLLSSPRVSIEGVGSCFVYGTTQIAYYLALQCDGFGSISVTVNILSSRVLTELHNTFGFPDQCDGTYMCGWYVGPPGFSTQRVVPTCAGGFLTGTVTFPPMPADICGPVAYVVSNVSFSIPYTVDPMCQSFLVVGCTGLGVAGATFNLYDHAGGTLLYSGTTNSGGGIPQVYFDNAPNPFWITVTSPDPRLQDHAGSHTLVCGTAPSNQTTITLALNSAYVCVTGCAIPVAKTLHTTHPKFGALTLVYNASGSAGAGWYASVSYSFTACRCCPAKTVTVTCFLNTSLVYTDFWKSL